MKKSDSWNGAAVVSGNSDKIRKKCAPRLFKGWRWIWASIRQFSGLETGSTCLWSRWWVLRAVGLVYMIIFVGVLHYQPGLAGPRGLIPLTDHLNDVLSAKGSLLAAVMAKPSLFWISSNSIMVGAVAWLGLVASVAVVLNLWPRVSLTLCWVTFLSFVTTWHDFSGAQLDGLMLEAALLCIPFAPAGFRPGLGAHSPPLWFTVLAMRWLLFRVMFESGMVKIMAGDPHWRNHTAMDVMYETSPFPTILGYYDHQMPHAYHLVEHYFTFVAELAAPLLAVFAGRWGRRAAFVVWTIFQAGIQLTNNFGWLNTASIGLGFLLLDDADWDWIFAKLRLGFVAQWLSRGTIALGVMATPMWLRLGFAIGLSIHSFFSVFFLAKACGGRVYEISPLLTKLVGRVAPFQSVNEYSLYARLKDFRYQVEYWGSNDNGRTWRPFVYRYIPQNPDEICPFIAPWFARFDASVEIAGWGGKRLPLIPVTASRLLQGTPEVISLFRGNPFPDAAPTLMRMQGVRLKFTDLETRRRTGNFWVKEPAGEYGPPHYVNEDGQILIFDLKAGNQEMQRGNIAGAISIFTQQYRAGYLAAGLKLVDIYMRAEGSLRDPSKAFSILQELAAAGEPAAENSLGLCYEFGLGTHVDYSLAEEWYLKAASHGFQGALFFLGSLYVKGQPRPGRDIEALAMLIQVRNKMLQSDPMADYIQARLPDVVDQLHRRMSNDEISHAERMANQTQ